VLLAKVEHCESSSVILRFEPFRVEIRLACRAVQFSSLFHLSNVFLIRSCNFAASCPASSLTTFKRLAFRSFDDLAFDRDALAFDRDEARRCADFAMRLFSAVVLWLELLLRCVRDRSTIFPSCTFRFVETAVCSFFRS
jgi:hypothetical protein